MLVLTYYMLKPNLYLILKDAFSFSRLTAPALSRMEPKRLELKDALSSICIAAPAPSRMEPKRSELNVAFSFSRLAAPAPSRMEPKRRLVRRLTNYEKSKQRTSGGYCGDDVWFFGNTCELLFGYIVDKVIFERQRNRVSAVLLVDKQVGVFFVGEEAVIVDHRDVGREKFA